MELPCDLFRNTYLPCNLFYGIFISFVVHFMEHFYYLLTKFDDLASANIKYKNIIEERNSSTCTFSLSNFLLQTSFGCVFVYKVHVLFNIENFFFNSFLRRLLALLPLFYSIKNSEKKKGLIKQTTK